MNNRIQLLNTLDAIFFIFFRRQPIVSDLTFMSKFPFPGQRKNNVMALCVSVCHLKPDPLFHIYSPSLTYFSRRCLHFRWGGRSCTRTIHVVLGGAQVMGVTLLLSLGLHVTHLCVPSLLCVRFVASELSVVKGRSVCSVREGLGRPHTGRARCSLDSGVLWYPVTHSTSQLVPNP